MAHDLGGALDLRHRLFRRLRHDADVDRSRAHRVVHQPRIGARRHQRLVELVRHRGGEFAHAAEPRQSRQLLLLQAQLRLGAPPLGHQFAGDQPGHRQHQHQRLERREVERARRQQLNAEDEAELRDQISRR